ncbi:MAG TPA: ABC transporter transmembrane domain-containing protein [Gemmataceae bacterium]|jgi:ATP-binding cassette subfamily B protein|nr:ABC transporter transmembrane domain-containing protein [Gemmataceae bacterium]
MARHRRLPDDVPPARISADSLREARQLFGYLRPYRGKFAAALAALLLSSLMGLLFPAVTGRLVDNALAKSVPEIPTGWLDNVNTTAGVMFAVLAVQAAFSFVQSSLFAEVGERALADLRRDTYGKIIRLPMAFFAQRRVGELSGRIAGDLAQIETTLIAVVPQFLRQLVLLIGGVAIIAVTSGRLAVVMLSSFPVLIGVAILFGRWIRKLSREAQDRLADSNVVVEETLQGVATVKAFTNEAYEQSRYDRGLRDYLTVAIRGARARAGFVAFIIFALFGAIVLVLWYGARLVQSGEMSAGELTRFLVYTMYVGGAIGSFAEVYGAVQRALGATHRVREILREEPEEAIVTPRTGRSEDSGAPLPSLRSVRGVAVQLEDVVFSYPARKEVPVLRGLSLEARAGQRVALVGPSGAGKSTAISLILRFYDPDAGRVVIDGRDARGFALGDLRGRMALVPQDVLLFGGTIADNIGYGKPGATAAEIEQAAQRANAHEFIASFPEGYKTTVGERGVKLSGGQRQRVAIARAILRDPEVLLLDEATSSLDSESERLVQQALDELMRGRTSVIIAHRLATVRRADRIFVIKHGVVAEAGTHEELLDRPGGVYRTLSELQFDLKED